jgi:hypothetical protein
MNERVSTATVMTAERKIKAKFEVFTAVTIINFVF